MKPADGASRASPGHPCWAYHLTQMLVRTLDIIHGAEPVVPGSEAWPHLPPPSLQKLFPINPGGGEDGLLWASQTWTVLLTVMMAFPTPCPTSPRCPRGQGLYWLRFHPASMMPSMQQALNNGLPLTRFLTTFQELLSAPVLYYPV